MLIPLLAAAVMAAAPVEATDTTIAVREGARLELSNFRGDVRVRTWRRNAVRIQAEKASDAFVEIGGSALVLRVRSRGHMGPPREVDYTLTVPPWMALAVEGNQLDADIAGVEGEVSVETVNGDITVRGGRGFVTLRSVQGEIRLAGARGRIDVESVNEDIALVDVSGDVVAATVNGDVTLRGVQGTSVRATTVNGDVVYSGTIRDGGRYRFSTHNGDVVVDVPRGTNATVSVSTYHGDFETDFPVRMTGTGTGRRFDFTLGNGAARMELESFGGTIQLRRPQ